MKIVFMGMWMIEVLAFCLEVRYERVVEWAMLVPACIALSLLLLFAKKFTSSGL